MLASLLAKNILSYSILSLFFGMVMASVGYYLAQLFDVTVSGTISLVALVSFLVLLLTKQIFQKTWLL